MEKARTKSVSLGMFKKLILVFVFLSVLIPGLTLSPEYSYAQEESSTFGDTLKNAGKKLLDPFAILTAPPQIASELLTGKSVGENVDEVRQRGTETLTNGIKSELNGLVDGIVETIAWGMIKVSSWFLGAAGTVMNMSIEELIIEMSNKVNGITGIDIAWRALRDIANVFFIFILLYISISLIIQRTKFDAKQALARLIIVALLMNFSMFFTKVVIDIANIATIALNGGAIESTESGRDHGLSGQLAQSMGITKAFSIKDAEQLGVKPLDKLLRALIISTFMTVTGFVMFIIAILLLVRFVFLIFLIILSPLAFLGYAFPNISGMSQRWFSELVKNAFFAPALFLMLTVVLIIIRSPGSGFTVNFDDLISPNVGITILNYFIVLGFVVIGVILANSLGVRGGRGAVNMLNWGGKFARGRVAGTAMLGGRQLQKTARAVAQTQGMRSFAKNSPLLGGSALRALNKTTGLGGKRSLDSKISAKKKRDMEIKKLLGEATDEEAKAHLASKIDPNDPNSKTRMQVITQKEARAKDKTTDQSVKARREREQAREEHLNTLGTYGIGSTEALASQKVFEEKQKAYASSRKKSIENRSKLITAEKEATKKAKETMYVEKFADKLEKGGVLNFVSKVAESKTGTGGAIGLGGVVGGVLGGPLGAALGAAGGVLGRQIGKHASMAVRESGKDIQKELNKNKDKKLVDDLRDAMKTT